MSPHQIDQGIANVNGPQKVRSSVEAARTGKWGPRQRASLAAGIAAVCWAFAGCGGSSKAPVKTSTTPQKAVPSIVSEDELKSYAQTLKHPLYWAGPRSNESYELTKTADGSSYIRYLPQGVPAGDKRPIFLTIGTYPRDNAFATVQQTAKQKGEHSVQLPGGGLAVPSPANPKSVYLSYPQSPVLVEIFSPDAKQSMQLAQRQAVVPIQ